MISVRSDLTLGWKWVCLCGAFTSLLVCTGCRGPEESSAKSLSKDMVLEKSVERGPVRLWTRVTPKEPRLSDVVELELLVVGREGIQIETPAFGQAVGDFLVLDYSEKKEDLFGNTVPPFSRLFRYRLEPVQAGKHLIRSLAIDFLDQRKDSESTGNKLHIESEPLEISVTSEWGDATPDLANLEPMLPPKEIAGSSSAVWMIPTLVALALGAAVFLFLRKRQSEIVLPIEKSPKELANIQLALLLSEELPAKGLFTEFYVRLTGIVRQYIEGTTGIRAPEQTTEEFLREMYSTKVFSAEQSVRLQGFLEAADMVKYAGQHPDEIQIGTSIERAREFIDMKLQSPLVRAGGD